MTFRSGWFPVLVVVSAALGGCLSDNPLGGAGAGGDPPAPATAPPVYACPDGTASADPCLQRIGLDGVALQEPYVALHPTDASIIAVGAIGAQQPGAPPVAANTRGLDHTRLEVLVSTDGGTSWTHRPLPHIPHAREPAPHAMSTAADPALSFDSRGVLHVTGYIQMTQYVTGIDIFHVASADLGATWTTPTLITTDSDNDRNWVSVGPDDTVYVTWQSVKGFPSPQWYAEVAYSRDGGGTWTHAKEPIEQCALPSPVAFIDDMPHFACATFEGEHDTGVAIVRLDPDTSTLTTNTVLDHLPVRKPLLSTTPGGGIIVAGTDAVANTALITISHDGGASWSRAVDLGEAAGVAGKWEEVVTYAMSTDPWGYVHVLVRGENFGDTTTARGRAVHHVVLTADPAVARVTALDVSPDGADEHLIGTSDHFGGIAFSAERGVLVWGIEDETIGATLVAPGG